MEGLGAGLAALGFWGFIAVCVIGGVWDGVRKREAKHETLRRLIDKGEAIDSEIVSQILDLGDNVSQDLRVAALIMLYIAPGLAVMGLALSFISAKALAPLLGAAALVGFISMGLFAASRAAAAPEDPAGQSKGDEG